MKIKLGPVLWTIALCSLPAIVLADPEYRYDDHGRIISVKDDSGTIISYSYDKNGEKIKNSNSQGEAQDMNSEGKSVKKRLPPKKK